MSIIKLHQDKPVTPANLVWEEPPARTRASGKYAEFAEALRGAPGRWAVIATFDTATKRRGWALTTVINSGKLIDFPKNEFRATCRTINGETRVYVHAVPTADANTTPLAVAQ